MMTIIVGALETIPRESRKVNGRIENLSKK